MSFSHLFFQSSFFSILLWRHIQYIHGILGFVGMWNYIIEEYKHNFNIGILGDWILQPTGFPNSYETGSDKGP